MADGDKAFTGSIPEMYDRYLVPLIFQAYADDIATRVGECSPSSVLETAAGSGVVTRALVERLDSDASISVTDLNQPMLDRAQSQQPTDTRFSWLQADALDLPFADASFDVVVCQFGVMFFPDRVAGYREALRVLKPGGRFLFNAWDHIQHNEFTDVVTEALAVRYPDSPPQFMARTPHGYNDIAQISADVMTAGYSSVDVETITHTGSADSPRDAAIAFCQGTPLRNEILDRDPDGLEAATHDAAQALATRFGNHIVTGKIRAHVITAVP